jgi:glycosyltransferase involved in cell wall biosynthesis
MFVRDGRQTGQETSPLGSHSLIDIVICTYNNVTILDRVLQGLVAQDTTDVSWSVLVVENNCTDATHRVIDEYIAAGKIPGLRVVTEIVQGLTPARLRGVHETAAPWIAFVDDDCLLDRGWIGTAADFAVQHPEAAAFGGRVAPVWAVPPTPFLLRYNWCYAAQDYGSQPCEVEFLVGAGVVINRSALTETGWTSKQYLDDRIGRRLISGGDVEIALRLLGTGRPLWFTPDCVIQHAISHNRTTVRYLAAMNRRLGTSYVFAEAMKSTAKNWLGVLLRDALAEAARLPWQAVRVIRGHRSELNFLHGLTASDFLLCACFFLGKLEGLARLCYMRFISNTSFVGCGASRRSIARSSGEL